MEKITRRLFLKNGGLAIASVGLLPVIGPSFLQSTVFGAEPTAQKRKKTLICIFQRGAADGLSMVVPHGDANLYRLRPDLAIAQPSRSRADSAVDLDGFFGLHPALASFAPIFKENKMAIIHACGSPDATRSHFDAQDFMESGTPGNKSVPDGWLSRAVLACPEDRAKLSTPFRALSVGTAALPRSLQGEADALAVPDLRSFGVADGRGGAMAANAMGSRPSGGAAAGFEAVYDHAVGDVLHGTGKESFSAIRMLRGINPNTYAASNGAVYPNGKFGESLKQIAQLIKADVGVEVAFAESGGWDTHAGQGTIVGRLATQLREFGGGITALYRDLGDRMDDVVILTMSEFGRTARQNGTGGTDHGHATAFFVMGSHVNGGKVLGQWPGLGDGQLNDNRDLALTTDFRAVFGEVATKHLGAQGVTRIFPGYTAGTSDFRGVLKV